MKKATGFLFVLMLVFFLAACGEETEKKDVDSVESSDAADKKAEKDAKEEKAKKEEAKDNTKEIDKDIADDDNVKATVTSIEKVEDKDLGEEKYEIKMDIENKLDDTIEVQAEEVSADGKMVDDYVTFSQTVSGKKSADGEMEINTYGEADLPSMDKKLEFTLKVLNEESYESIKDYNVNIDFK